MAEFAKVPLLLLIIIIRQMCYDDIFVGMMMMMMMMMILVIRVFSNSAGKWQCKFVLNCINISFLSLLSSSFPQTNLYRHSREARYKYINLQDK